MKFEKKNHHKKLQFLFIKSSRTINNLFLILSISILMFVISNLNKMHLQIILFYMYFIIKLIIVNYEFITTIVLVCILFTIINYKNKFKRALDEIKQDEFKSIMNFIKKLTITLEKLVYNSSSYIDEIYKHIEEHKVNYLAIMCMQSSIPNLDFDGDKFSINDNINNENLKNYGNQIMENITQLDLCHFDKLMLLSLFLFLNIHHEGLENLYNFCSGWR